MRRLRLLIVFLVCAAISGAVLISISGLFEELSSLGCSDDFLDGVFYALLLPGRLLTYELYSAVGLVADTREGITNCFLVGDTLIFAVLLLVAWEVLRKFGKPRSLCTAARSVLVVLGSWLFSGAFVALVEPAGEDLSHFQPGRLIASVILSLAGCLGRGAPALDRATRIAEWSLCWLVLMVVAWQAFVKVVRAGAEGEG